MKHCVYVVENRQDDDYSPILGIFSSRDKAQEALGTMGSHGTSCIVQQWELDYFDWEPTEQTAEERKVGPYVNRDAWGFATPISNYEKGYDQIDWRNK